MVDIGEDETDYADRIAANADVLKSAWEGTIEDMKAMAGDREADGWDVFYVAAGHTAPESPDAGDSDRWGLVHVIPDNYADGFEEAFAAGSFPEYDVYRQEMEGTLFVLTELRDPDSKTAIFLAGSLTLFEATGLVTKSRSAGKTYTHVHTLDKTHLGSFEHDEPAKFFPHFEEYDAHFGGREARTE